MLAENSIPNTLFLDFGEFIQVEKITIISVKTLEKSFYFNFKQTLRFIFIVDIIYFRHKFSPLNVCTCERYIFRRVSKKCSFFFVKVLLLIRITLY